MTATHLALIGALAFIAWSSFRSVAKGAAPIEPKRPRIIPGKVRIIKGKTIEPKRPLKLEFFIRVTGIEKWVYGIDDVKKAVEEKSNIGPGTGQAKVFVKDADGGYNVRIQWPDSTGRLTEKQALALINGTHKQMIGRVSRVKVTQ